MKTLPFSVFHKPVCKTHGIVDVLPCPWPNCVNGIEEDQFKIQRLFEGEDDKIYSRREWKTPEGKSYYTWELENFTLWLSCNKTLWAEASRQGLIQETSIDKIYHYTSLEGFLGILESQTLWLSDYSYLNDKREILHGFDIIKKVIEEKLSNETSESVISLLKTWLSASENGNNRICVASFSDQNDSLSQWRACGPIAIGFELHTLGMHCNQIRLKPVEYDLDKQKKLVEIFINHLIQAFIIDSANNSIERIPDVYHRFEQLIELVAFFKDQAFRDEREYRAAYVEHPYLYEESYFQKPAKKFRIRDNKIIPYVVSSEVFPDKDENTRNLGICEIILGPETDDVLFRGVKEYLSEMGMKHIPVIQSKVPFRA